jgi:hypothetical protein
MALASVAPVLVLALALALVEPPFAGVCAGGEHATHAAITIIEASIRIALSRSRSADTLPQPRGRTKQNHGLRGAAEAGSQRA